MDGDLLLVLGLVMGAVAVPSLLSAWNDGRPPRAGAVAILIAGTLVALALRSRPGGYQIEEIPQVFARVIGHYLR